MDKIITIRFNEKDAHMLNSVHKFLRHMTKAELSKSEVIKMLIRSEYNLQMIKEDHERFG